jgi:hypothetical protein
MDGDVPHESSSPTTCRRASRSVSLALISSSLILSGCYQQNDTACDMQPANQDGKPVRKAGCRGSSSYYHGGRWFWHSYAGSNYRSGGGSYGGRGMAVSSRGGFGAMGHAAGS